MAELGSERVRFLRVQPRRLAQPLARRHHVAVHLHLHCDLLERLLGEQLLGRADEPHSEIAISDEPHSAGVAAGEHLVEEIVTRQLVARRHQLLQVQPSRHSAVAQHALPPSPPPPAAAAAEPAAAEPEPEPEPGTQRSRRARVGEVRAGSGASSRTTSAPRRSRRSTRRSAAAR